MTQIRAKREGSVVVDRCERVQEILRERDLDAILITRDSNIRYVSGFTGSESFVVLSASDRVFITDSRYTEQAEQECARFRVVRYRDPYPSIEETLQNVASSLGIRRLGFERQSISFDLHSKISETLKGVEFVPTSGVVETPRYTKNPEEVALVRRAAGVADAAFNHILGIVRPGVSEKDIELELDCFMRKNGAFASAFPIIVASGTRSSLPHAVPTEKKVQEGDFVTMDFGALFEGYRSDMTRTVIVGRAEDRQREVYDVVKRAQEEGIRAVRAGVKGSEPDRAARAVIEAAGLGDNFGHGLGHGVGLEVHEEPRMSRESDSVLSAGCIVTVEPGVYIPGWGGVRIEDTVLVLEDSCEALTLSPKEMIVL